MVLTHGLTEQHRQALAPPPALPARPDHRRRGDLLVHRRLDPGGRDRRLPRGRVHQGEHQARRRREGLDRGLARRSSRSARSTRRRACSTSSWPSSSRTLAFAFLEPFFFIGYLISIALFGLFQAIFMANAGGAWDNAKKVVEVELKEKGTPLHAATVVGDTVGDPFKDTSSVAMNPIIKFTTLFGLLGGRARDRDVARRERDPRGRLLRAVPGLRVPLLLRDADSAEEVVVRTDGTPLAAMAGGVRLPALRPARTTRRCLPLASVAVPEITATAAEPPWSSHSPIRPVVARPRDRAPPRPRRAVHALRKGGGEFPDSRTAATSRRHNPWAMAASRVGMRDAAGARHGSSP